MENPVFNETNSGKQLNFVDKLLNPKVRQKVEEYVKNKSTNGPVIVEFDPTSNCNFACPECISADLLNKGQITPKRVYELIDEFHMSGVKGIIFIGGGEPLAHSDMPRPIVYTRELGMAVGLTTNGSLINRHINAIAENVNWTRVSLDAGTQSTHNLFRPSKIKESFLKIIESMAQLAKIKTGVLGYSFLLIERQLPSGDIVSNYNEIFTAAKIAKEIGCDYFEFKPMVDEKHNLIPLSENNKRFFLDEIPKLLELNSNNFSIIYPNSFDHLMQSAIVNQPKDYHSCPTLELRTVVTPSGIYPCPYKRGMKIIGDSSENFTQFWASKERKNMIKNIDPSRDCPFYCIRHETNVVLISLKDAFSRGVDLLEYLKSKEEVDDVFL